MRYKNGYNKTRLNSHFSADVLRRKQNELKDTQNQYRVVADIPHSLLTLKQQIHINTMFENRNTESCTDIDTHQYFVNSNKYIQSIITFIVDILCYPVVPAYVAGTILPSLDGVYNNGVEVHEPGANCYRKVTTLYSPWACLYFKLRNLTFGHTDTQDQSIRMVCECVMKNNDYQSIQRKANTISRTIPPTTKKYVEVLSKKKDGMHEHCRHLYKIYIQS